MTTAMFTELAEQPRALAAVAAYYSGSGVISVRVLKKLAPRRPPLVVFTGMGSSFYAAFPAQAYLSAQRIPSVVFETSELLHHHLGILDRKTLLVMVSQSGETVETVRLLRRLPRGMRVVGVVNAERCTLARRADLTLPMLAGGQTTVSTKTYTCAVAALMYLAWAIPGKPPLPVTRALKLSIMAQEDILAHRDEWIAPLVEFFADPPYAALMARGADVATVFQGALMFKEVVRLGAEPISAGQFRHGPVEIINPAHRYLLVARRGRAGRLVLRLARDIATHGGRVLLLTDLPFAPAPNIHVTSVPPIPLGLGTLVDSVYIQLLAHDLALRAGRDPGKFWIAQEVTLEE